MGNYKIRVKVEVIECEDQGPQAPSEQNDGSFEMIIDGEDAISIDKSEKALLSTAYPSIREALSKHLEKISKKKSLKKKRRKK
jgi:hypothetical protein